MMNNQTDVDKENDCRSPAHRGAPDWAEGAGGEAGEDRRLGAAGGHLRRQEEGHARRSQTLEASNGGEVELHQFFVERTFSM